MKSTYFQANLASLTKINLLVFTSVPVPKTPVFYLEKDGNEVSKLKIVRHISNNEISIFNLEMEKEYEYGHSYAILYEGLPRINLETSEAVNFPDFDEKFYYDGDDLGSIYTKEETKFALWAPTASEVTLKIEEKGEFHFYKMVRTYKGVYRCSLKGDHLNERYHYLVTVSGVTNETIDPYGKGVSFNSEYSAVIDLSLLKEIKKEKPTYKVESNRDAIIYEASIRDFTEDKNTNIVNKGKYLGMVEENRKTKGNHPAGLDYLKYLGITHLQILPVIDFYGNDDKDISKGYNWGYNPISFFAIEGSYSINPEDPFSRLKEFKSMVEILHKNNIRVVMDVVYNHVYEFMYTCFEKSVPNYYFRRQRDGRVAIASGCGDDFASEKKMARKAIIDSLKYFTDVFDIDGFRFDLMGLLDIETINKGFEECKKIKEDVIFYGEGWNMGIELPFEKKACSDNADKMPGIGFFNDSYREILKGGNFKDNLSSKGYICGKIDNQIEVNYALRGCSIDIPYKARFKNPDQSLNYVECHDNNTLFDKLLASNPNEDISTLLKRVEFANSLISLSFGIPFYHMGQEIGLSKNGLDNTYNVLKVNNMDYKLLDERFEMVSNLRNFINIRKSLKSYIKFDKHEEINQIFETQYWNNDMMVFYTEKDNIAPMKKLLVLINPTLEKKTYELDDYFSLLLSLDNKGDQINMKNGIIPPLSVQILYKK